MEKQVGDCAHVDHSLLGQRQGWQILGSMSMFQQRVCDALCSKATWVVTRSVGIEAMHHLEPFQTDSCFHKILNECITPLADQKVISQGEDGYMGYVSQSIEYIDFPKQH